MSESPTVWEVADTAPDYCQAISALWSWSLNYYLDDPRRPFPLFLDLVGFSHEEYGERVSGWGRSGTTEGEWLGWVELDYLADAMKEWAERPSECADFIRRLIDAPEG